MWLAAFGRLLFSIPVPAASSLFPAAEPLQQAAVEVDGRPGTGTVLQLSTGLKPVDSAVNELLWQLLEPSPATSADPVQIYAFAFQWLWLGGMAVLLLTGLFRYGLLKRRISDAVPAEETQCTVRGKRLERVYITDRIQMPMVLGIWKPRILLPSACSGEGRKEERELILAHEQAHRLRYDHVTKVFVFGVLVIHWFNPLAWAAFLLYCRDVEMACDEKVMEWLGEESRKPYSLALLRFEEERSVLLIPLAFGESSARERIRHILNYRKPGSWMTALALLLAALAAGFFLMAPDGKAQDAVSIIGGADGPTSIFLAGKLGQTEYLGPIAVAAYSYMALVPIIQPPIMKLLTTEEERKIKMEQLRPVSKLEKILFPIIVTVVVCLILPTTAPLVGMLMLGNLFRESGVVDQLAETASNALMYIVVIILGTSVGATTSAEAFLKMDTIKIVILGLVAFALGTAGGVLLGKVMCKVTHGKVNPLIGSAGVSAVPMAARVSQKVGAEADPTNFLLMHAMGPNVAGVIGTAVAAGTFMAIFGVK